MPHGLEPIIEAGEYSKAFKITNPKVTRGKPNSMFYTYVTAYCLLSQDPRGNRKEVEEMI